MSESRHYAAFYCEENIWWLAQEAALAPLAREVVFVTNDDHSVAVFAQRAGRGPDRGIVWDYHVVLAVRAASGTEIWDLDSTLGAPVAAPAWLEASFAGTDTLPPWFQPRFRVIGADDFVATFSSDRSHMRSRDGRWKRPPPAWPAIARGPSNLDRYLDLDDALAGEVVDLPALRGRYA